MFPAALKEGRLRESFWVKHIADLGPKLALGTNILLTLGILLRNGIAGAFGRNTTLALIMAGSFAIHLWTRPKRSEIIKSHVDQKKLRIVSGVYSLATGKVEWLDSK